MQRLADHIAKVVASPFGITSFYTWKENLGFWDNCVFAIISGTLCFLPSLCIWISTGTSDFITVSYFSDTPSFLYYSACRLSIQSYQHMQVLEYGQIIYLVNHSSVR